MEVSWTTVKAAADSGFKLRYFEERGRYFIYAFDDSFSFYCTLPNLEEAGDEQEDFETNYKTAAESRITDTDGTKLIRTKPLANTDNLLFRATGFTGTATKNTTSNIDYQIPEQRFITGAAFMCKNHVWGDKACLQVVDVDNLLGFGAGLVLNEFVKDWYMIEDQQSQGLVQTPYPAKLIQGLYLRIAYSSVGTESDVQCAFNWFFHKKQ